MNRTLSWTARLKAKICDERGLTMIELLVVVAIMAITGSVLTSTLVTGQKIFTKQTAETQFREDADYVTTRIMNEFYATPFDEVAVCENTGPGCIRIIDNTETTFRAVKNENEDSHTTYYYDPAATAKSKATETKISILNEQVQIEKSETVNGQAPSVISTEVLEAPSRFQPNESGEAVFQLAACSAQTAADTCRSGTIQLSFTLGSSLTTETMRLESRFGF